MVVIVLNSHQAAKRLVHRVRKNFKNISHTRYWIVINYYSPLNGYNIFFNMTRPKMFSRSIPVGEYNYCQFTDLIKILKEFRQTFNFSIEYRHFSKEQLHILYKERLI